MDLDPKNGETEQLIRSSADSDAFTSPSDSQNKSPLSAKESADSISRVKPVGNTSADAISEHLPDDDELEDKSWSVIRFFRATGRVLVSSLTRKIVLMNLIALAVLLSTILYLNQFREGLIDARIESLLTQGRIIADAISVSATVDTNAITLDPDKLLELQTGESSLPNFDNDDSLDFPINPEKIALILRELIQPTRTRARIYDPEGTQVLDSRNLYAGGQVIRFNLPDINQPQEEVGMIKRIGNLLNQLLQRQDLPIYEELLGTGQQYPEVSSALFGAQTPIVRLTKTGELIVSVAVPIQRFRVVRGVLLLSTQGGDIDRIVAEERLAILRIFLVAAIVMIVLSIFLASAIASPLRKLSAAAIRVRHGGNTQVEIPDFSSRQDEIGNLSVSLRDMTESLYARIAAIESFAADVSHELKNPLTSLRSAVETLPLVKNIESRDKLLDIIQHDVQRLNRLITDISDASRLDAELGREDTTQVNVADLLRNIVDAYNAPSLNRSTKVHLHIAENKRFEDPYVLSGHQSRLGQVFNNLIDNAASFVPKQDGGIWISLVRLNRRIRIIVEDNGPGIQAENRNRVFERFYTDRPDEEAFGENSGLGLSISKQIIEAHNGTISADNSKAANRGAMFVIHLPADISGG